MSKIGTEISTLLFEPGQAGADMTHRLKVLGNGSMQNGIKIIADFFTEEGINIGEVRGIIKGSVGTAIVATAVFGSVHLIKEHRKNVKDHETKGKKIYTVLHKAECNEEQPETEAIE